MQTGTIKSGETARGTFYINLGSLKVVELVFLKHEDPVSPRGKPPSFLPEIPRKSDFSTRILALQKHNEESIERVNFMLEIQDVQTINLVWTLTWSSSSMLSVSCKRLV